ncbi:MAG: MSMEG_0569 family flavin-dependent oxidoreductase, partial [Bradyrhizobiaceae bacterium]|nr:MSMEG_0569 family flavin-dependent oxidoreductase [Bradyrhizobiaceae bacterium]
PGHPYAGPDPDGFMTREEIIDYLAGFRNKVDAPLREGVTVRRVGRRADGTFDVITSTGEFIADQVVAASGGYTVPIIPRMAERVAPRIVQLHSELYRNPGALPDGAVLVVGSGQSGAQIAEDLHLAGRKVHLAVGNAPRCARFYRGKDVVTWLAEMGYYEMPVEKHPLKDGVRDNANHYVTGRDGGRDIDLRKFALEGMRLYGLLDGMDGGTFSFRPTLKVSLDAADRVYNGINAAIDKYIAERGIAAPPSSVYTPLWEPEAEPATLDLDAEGVSAIIWCIGFQPDFRWLDAAVFNGAGHPKHHRGVTAEKGIFFLGLPWLHSWGSGRFSGIARDACYVAERICENLAGETARQSALVD